MCFSAPASFTAAAVISVIGLVSFLKARTFPMKLFMLTPFIFAVQQCLEGLVWITTTNPQPGFLHSLGVYGFLFFAYVFWPVWMPACVYLIEKNKKIKKILRIIFFVGVLCATRFLFDLILYKYTGKIIDHHMTYPIINNTHSIGTIEHYNLLFSAAYLLATIVPFFISTIRYMWLIGFIILGGFVTAEIFYALAFGSVWCYFGALSSIFAYLVVSTNKH